MATNMWHQSMSSLNKNLLALCELHGITPKELSNLCGVTMEDIHDWKNGVKEIPMDTLMLISNTLHIDIGKLM